MVLVTYYSSTKFKWYRNGIARTTAISTENESFPKKLKRKADFSKRATKSVNFFPLN
jgi:hypothetical protein